MNYSTVRIILEKVISSPNVDMAELDEAIRWVEDRGTIQRLDRGADPNAYSSRFEAAAVEMRVLGRLLARGDFLKAAESAQRGLTLLAS
jgi:hypothetical protein